MTRLPMLHHRLAVIVAATAAFLPWPLEARIDPPPAMTTTASNAKNPTALENLTGGILTFAGSTLSETGLIRNLQTSDTSWSTLFQSPNNIIVAAQHGNVNAAVIGSEFNDLPNATTALPAGIIGYGKLDGSKTGNQVFGIYGLAENPAASGVAVSAEFTCRNSGGAPDTALPPNQSIGTPTIGCVGLQITSGGTFDSSIGVRISREAGSAVNFNTAMYVKDYTQYGLYIANQSGAADAIYAAGPVAIVDPAAATNQALTVSATSNATAGASILMQGNGGTTPNKRLRVLSGHFGIVNSANTQEILTLTDAGALTVQGGLTATGGTLTNATFVDTINQEFEVSAATLTKTSDTALAVVPGLTQALTAGKTYHCRGHLTGSSGASGGIKVALLGTGGLTATQTTFTGFTWNGTTAVANTTVTTLGSNITANTAAYSDIQIDGSIVVNAGGTINVEAAQNASNATATTVLQGSTFSCVRVN